jgi:hypothetical protein
MKKQYHDMSVGLNERDRARPTQRSKERGVTKSELAREAIRCYIANYEEIKGQTRDGEIAAAMRYATEQIVKAINGGIDRICKMLARQGRAIGTLYELSWMSLPDDEDARKAFEAAPTRAKQKMARHVENDEKEFAERLKKVVNN